MVAQIDAGNRTERTQRGDAAGKAVGRNADPHAALYYRQQRGAAQRPASRGGVVVLDEGGDRHDLSAPIVGACVVPDLDVGQIAKE